MITRKCWVTVEVDVTVDETKFTPEWLAEYCRYYYKSVDTVDRHIERIAGLCATGRDGFDSPDEFVEGYGPIGELGISADNLGVNEVEFA